MANSIDIIVAQYNDGLVYAPFVKTTINGNDEVSVRAQAEGFRKPGLCVIVRPNYNDCVGPNGIGKYHELRSFDGEEFKCVYF